MSVLANTDSYKLSHKGFMNSGTSLIYSNLTPRSDKYFTAHNPEYDHKMVFFGLQHFIKDYLIKEWNESFFDKPKHSVIGKFKRLIDAYLGKGAVPVDHFEELHDLGYLPIAIKALPEGARVNIGVPVLTIENTHKKFAWLTNYLETVMSSELWKPSTTATIIAEYRKLVNRYAQETTGSLDGTEFQLHGFEFRGMSGRHDAAINGAAFLLSSCGTDTVPALELIENSYHTNIDDTFIATSVPASEHSIACLGTAVEGELDSYRRWITESYPSGIVSLVSDTYDYWKVLTEYLPELKQDILSRPQNDLGLSKVVIRPDSGDPVDIICGTAEVIHVEDEYHLDIYVEDTLRDIAIENQEHGEHGPDEVTAYFKYKGETYKAKGYPFWNRYDKRYYYFEDFNSITLEKWDLTPAEKGSIEILWEIFGGETTDQGYKVLDSHIGLIYGDSITYQRASEILRKLKAKGFASTNVIFGIGSYTMNMISRDTLGMAVKATYAEVDGVGYELFKDPITDDGTKKSARGLLKVYKEGSDYKLTDQQDKLSDDELKLVFINGFFRTEYSFSEIRSRLWGSN